MKNIAFKLNFIKHKILFFTAITFNIFLNAQLFIQNYSHTLILLWVISILFFILSFFSFLNKSFSSANLQLQDHSVPNNSEALLKKQTISNKLLFLLTIIMILFPAFIRIINYNINRIHQDDLITAYFSAQLTLKEFNFFEPVPINPTQWVSQFPSLFFVLQKAFFILFGENLLTIKLSIIPYVIITSLVLFLIVKAILDFKAAVISLIIYAFLAIALYHETLGLHFASSTALFTLFFYFAFLNYQQNSPSWAALEGVTAGFCYLFYTSSYIALPIMLIFYLGQFLKHNHKKIQVSKNLTISLIGFFVVMSPYLVHTYKTNNYFSSRIDQVSLTSGSWSNYKETSSTLPGAIIVAKNNLLLSFKSFYEDDIGGHGGYDFGHLSFFDRFTFFTFIIGSIIGLILSVKKKRELFFVFIAIIAAFITGMGLTIPPPAYHRLSVIFPLLAIPLSLPFYVLLKTTKLSLFFKYSLLVIFLFFFSFINQIYFIKSTLNENHHSDIELASYINQYFPSRRIYIASFPEFAFEKIYYFSNQKSALSIETDYHINLFSKLNPKEKYLFVVTLFSPEFKQALSLADQKGRFIPFSDTYTLFAN